MTDSDAPVEIVPYDASWSEQFQTEARLCVSPSSPGWLDPEHIGSTAVPGLAAKPVIDILFGVNTLDASRPAIPAAARLGYCYAPYRVAGSVSRLRCRWGQGLIRDDSVAQQSPPF